MMSRFSAIVSVLLVLTAGVMAEDAARPATSFKVRRIYDDYMVLQRGMPIRIGGTANPNEAVRVSIGSNRAAGIADANGEWTAVLPPMEAGGPYRVVVSGAPGCDEIVFNDVLIGEVWLASGQSNMEMPVFSTGPFWSSMNGEAEAAAADYPDIRLYNASARKQVSPYGPQADTIGPGWRICTPETAAAFSAVAFYFGRQLRQDLKGVPVGLINASWSGTRIEPWISRDGFAGAGRARELAQIDQVIRNREKLALSFEAARTESLSRFREWEKRFFAAYAEETEAAAGWKSPGMNDSQWQVLTRLANSFPADKDGVGWYRKTVEIPASWAGGELTLSLGVIHDCDEAFFNGFKVGVTGFDLDGHQDVRRVYKVPGEFVKPGRTVIAVRLTDYFMTGGFQSPSSEMYLSNGKGERLPLGGEWRFKLEFTADPAKTGFRPDPLAHMKTSERHPNFPATLYNAMIAPWGGFPIRGVIWYQGESSVGAPADYLEFQKLLIADWRRLWRDPELAFIFVQLSGFERHTPEKRLPDGFRAGRPPGDSAWAELREAQAAVLSVPRTGMAVSIDAGDHSDIHPANKQVVGFRLCKEAGRLCYGRNEISAGPHFKSMAVRDGKAVLSFGNTGGGLTARGNADGRLNGFAVAGKDGRFVRADAVIDGDKVVAGSPEVREPAAVRYGWSDYAGDLNFYNQEGFPAVPFRTDVPDYIGG